MILSWPAVAGNIDLLLIIETKIDSSFLVNQFYLNFYRNDPTEMTAILTVVGFWFMFAMTLCYVQLNVKIYYGSFEGLVIELLLIKKMATDLLLQSS